MAFPSSPSNNQQALVNGITYIYNSTKTAWLRASTTGANLTANSLTLTSNLNAISNTSGALIVTGGAGIGGNLYVGGNIFGSITGNIYSFGTVNATNGLTVTGTITATGNISGNLVATNIYGTLATAAQPNITSTGILSSLNVTGNVLAAVHSGGAVNVSGNVLASNLVGTLLTTNQYNVTRVGTLANLLIAPGATANVGIGTATPYGNLDVSGTINGKFPGWQRWFDTGSGSRSTLGAFVKTYPGFIVSAGDIPYFYYSTTSSMLYQMSIYAPTTVTVTQLILSQDDWWYFFISGGTGSSTVSPAAGLGADTEVVWTLTQGINLLSCIHNNSGGSGAHGNIIGDFFVTHPELKYVAP